MDRMNKTTLALLPGSYDPITNGHLDVIRRASEMFDSVVVAVMNNDMKEHIPTEAAKSYRFTAEQRQHMAEVACVNLENVRVVASSGLLIDLFDELGADVIIKGVRNEQDFAYEQKQALWNRAHNERAQTLYLPADPALNNVSSTLVRQRLQAGQGVDDLVPPLVAAYLKEV